MSTQTSSPSGNTAGSPSQDAFLAKLRAALSHDGDFPTSAKIVTELKLLTSNPNTTTSQVAEIILREPSLGARVLHIVNSSFYHRGNPIMTISQAVVRLGMKPLAELCSGLVLLQKFGSISRRGHVFSRCLTQTIITALTGSALNRSLAPSATTAQSNEESGYLAGSISEMGTLLLAYYFPEVYENASKRSEVKNTPLSQSIRELVGLTPVQISLEVANSLELPEVYRKILEGLNQPAAIPEAAAAKGVVGVDAEEAKVARTVGAITVAREISESISSGKGKSHLDQILTNSAKSLKVDVAKVSEIVGKLTPSFKEHCAAIELNLPPLPDFLTAYAESAKGEAPPTKSSGDEEDRFQQFVDEIRQAVEAREPSSSVITTVMETLSFGLNLERVLLMLASSGKRSLQGRMALGSNINVDPKKIDRPLGAAAGQFAPDAKAFQESRPVFTGDPVLENGWPFVAIPVGFGKSAIGIIYADRVTPDAQELTTREKAAIGMLAELINKSVTTGG